MMIHKITPSLWRDVCLKHLNTELNKPINHNLIEQPIVPSFSVDILSTHRFIYSYVGTALAQQFYRGVFPYK